MRPRRQGGAYRSPGGNQGRRRDPAIFARIVLATDLSPAWNEIAACGGELRALGCSLAILTHVITPDFFTGAGEKAPPRAAPALAAQREQLTAQGLQVIVETPIGLPASSLNQVAQKYDASLVVMGSHGKSLWREGVLGSFSSAVLHHAQYPLLILPVRVPVGGHQESSLWRCSELLRHLLFPTDFSATAAEALCCLELLAPRGVLQVTLLHALLVPPGEFYEARLPETLESAARNSLEILQGRVEAAGVPLVDTRLASGHPVSVILDVLTTLDISLIVMGTQGKGFIKEIFLGSVAHNITRVAPCPVLLFPPLQR